MATHWKPNIELQQFFIISFLNSGNWNPPNSVHFHIFKIFFFPVNNKKKLQGRRGILCWETFWNTQHTTFEVVSIRTHWFDSNSNGGKSGHHFGVMEPSGIDLLVKHTWTIPLFFPCGSLSLWQSLKLRGRGFLWRIPA